MSASSGDLSGAILALDVDMDETGAATPLLEHEDFDWVRAAEVETWIRDVLAEGRGLNGPDFTETEVTAAFEKLKQCVYAIDGLSRKYVFSLLKVLLVLLQFS